jgi:hypothetical protein
MRRFVSGLASTEFQDLAGPEVLAANYVIFLHLLARLYERAWVDVEAIVEATTKTIEAIWGSEMSPGYIARLDPDEAETVLSLVREKHSDAQLLALIFSFARDLRQSQSTDLRLQVRDAWRRLLIGGRLPLDADTLRDTVVLLRPLQPPDGPLLSDVVEELRLLAEFRTHEELIQAVRQRFATKPGCCYLDTVRVRIPSEGREAGVECISIDDDDITFTVEDAQWTLAAWMQVETKSYYRVQVRSQASSRTRFVAFYQPKLKRGHYAAVDPERHAVELRSLPSPEEPWDDVMLTLMVAAEEQNAACADATSEKASG